MNAWDDRMGGSDRLPNGDAWAHRIDGPSGDRLRVIYNEFDAKKIAKLLGGDGNDDRGGKDKGKDKDKGRDKDKGKDKDKKDKNKEKEHGEDHGHGHGKED
jgi:hypothetical protein